MIYELVTPCHLRRECVIFSMLVIHQIFEVTFGFLKRNLTFRNKAQDCITTSGCVLKIRL